MRPLVLACLALALGCGSNHDHRVEDHVRDQAFAIWSDFYFRNGKFPSISEYRAQYKKNLDRDSTSEFPAGWEVEYRWGDFVQKPYRRNLYFELRVPGARNGGNYEVDVRTGRWAIDRP